MWGDAHRQDNPLHSYFLNELEIKSTQEEKDLGVTFDPKLTFDVHIQQCINKANRLIGIIRRAFDYLDRDSFLLIYKSLVRPHLEYPNVIWSPHLKRQSLAVERVQRRATKIILDVRKLPYCERLQYFKLPSLKYRRFRGDLIQVFKILNGIDDLEVGDFFTISTSNTRYAPTNLYIKTAATNIKYHCFSRRSARYWNGLSKRTKNANSLNDFKKLLDADNKKVINKFDID